jgi:GT2 family glycosyltransferase
MSTLRYLSESARSWLGATGSPNEQTWFDYPYLGHPCDHHCRELRSRRSSVSIIIPLWNSAASVAQCLLSVRMSSFNRLAPQRLEVILCDDGSSDDSWEVMKSSAVGIKTKAFRLPHHSQSCALNFGLAQAEGEVVLLCDSDMILGCGTIDELVSRQEMWPDAVCFGFRSDISDDSVGQEAGDIWQLMHEEAFSDDKRVAFDTPTVEPNMLLASRWLTALGSGAMTVDCHGSGWLRHHFLHGCLFSVSRRLLHESGLFPDALQGWGYNDILMAARLEANGAFLLPVASAWGHHIHHHIRHPAQWFQRNRNHLAYEYLMDHSLSDKLWRCAIRPQPLDAVTMQHEANTSLSLLTPTDVSSRPYMLARIGKWQECLASQHDSSDHNLVAECLFRLGDYESIAQQEHLWYSVWGVLSLHRCRSLKAASNALMQAVPADATCTYVASASVPELRQLGNVYESSGMHDIAQNYSDLAEILSMVT